MAALTEQQTQELNQYLACWQKQANQLINDPYYDSIAHHIFDVQMQILTRVTNAKTHEDINVHLWNSGLVEKVLRDIRALIDEAKRDANRQKD